MTSLVWFRDDLRLSDNPALTAGAADPEGVICVYLYDQESLELRRLGAATRWWLHHSLDALGQCLSQRGATLILRRGPARRVIPELVAETGSTSVFWNRRYGPGERVVDADIKTMLQAVGVQAQSFPANLLHEPWTVTTSAGTPYRVYSAYWRACLQLPPPRHPIPVPATLPASSRDPHSESLHALRLLPHDPDWSGGLAKRWVPGEASAHRTLDRFLTTRIDSYPTGRDQLGQDLTSGLSPHLRFGEVSPHTVWDRATRSGASTEKFLAELGWREFAWHTLYHLPALGEENVDTRFDHFPWQKPDPELLQAWQNGATGIPVVDAGMRELWATGTMHNRARMIVASFLTKNLLYHWRIGEEWFWDTLVDADAASNPFNWQWVAGTGLDAAPYFRIFNPLTQQKKFDPDSTYVNRWAPDSIDREPILDLAASRQRALAAFQNLPGRRLERLRG